MEETLITFQVAKLAKEKGFSSYNSIAKTICKKYDNCENIVNGECSCTISYKYFNNKLHTLPHRGAYNMPDWGDFHLMTLVLEFPTQSILQKWLREKHDIHIFIIPCAPYSFSKNKDLDVIWIFTICKPLLVEYGCPVKNEFRSYEEALEEGLEQALKLI